MTTIKVQFYTDIASAGNWEKEVSTIIPVGAYVYPFCSKEANGKFNFEHGEFDFEHEDFPVDDCLFVAKENHVVCLVNAHAWCSEVIQDNLSDMDDFFEWFVYGMSIAGWVRIKE